MNAPHGRASAKKALQCAAWPAGPELREGQGPLQLDAAQPAAHQPELDQRQGAEQAAGPAAEAEQGRKEWDPLQRKAWHPSFHLNSLAMEQCRAAAVELAAEKACQEVQQHGFERPQVGVKLAACPQHELPGAKGASRQPA